MLLQEQLSSRQAFMKDCVTFSSWLKAYSGIYFVKMSRLSRFLPKFLRGDKTAGQKTSDKSQCKIIFLDETEYYIPYKVIE